LRLPALSGAQMSEKPKINWVAFLPIILFAALAGVFAFQLYQGKNSADLPSALIGKAAPQTDLPPLDATSIGLKSADFIGRVTVVNVFASWCVPCREEHPTLLELAKDKRFTLAGLNYKDKPENAQQFLNDNGNPYAVIGADISGRAGIDWGVYGVPETYVIGKDGAILYKHVGPLDADAVAKEIVPVVERALAG
jgi:cytochrome c biogenesis protein CcmG, thiol:disulfide interchange protein DsbE